jgi:hypothetical protein
MSKIMNFIASHLLKFCHFREDTQGFKMELRFLRDTDKREVDFVVLEEGKPLFAVAIWEKRLVLPAGDRPSFRRPVLCLSVLPIENKLLCVLSAYAVNFVVRLRVSVALWFCPSSSGVLPSDFGGFTSEALPSLIQ